MMRQMRASSKALRLRPDLARLGELCTGGGGDSGGAPLGVMPTSAGALCMSRLSCSSSLATCGRDSRPRQARSQQSMPALALPVL